MNSRITFCSALLSMINECVVTKSSSLLLLTETTYAHEARRQWMKPRRVSKKVDRANKAQTSAGFSSPDSPPGLQAGRPPADSLQGFPSTKSSRVGAGCVDPLQGSNSGSGSTTDYRLDS